MVFRRMFSALGLLADRSHRLDRARLPVFVDTFTSLRPVFFGVGRAPEDDALVVPRQVGAQTADATFESPLTREAGRFSPDGVRFQRRVRRQTRVLASLVDFEDLDERVGRGRVRSLPPVRRLRLPLQERDAEVVAGPLAVLGRAVAVVAQVEAHLVVGVVEAGRPRGLVLVGLGREGWKGERDGGQNLPLRARGLRYAQSQERENWRLPAVIGVTRPAK